MLSSIMLFLSAPDITIILVIALVLFGGKKLPELARGLGQGIKEFKDATDGSKNDTPNPPVKETPVTTQPPAAPVTPVATDAPSTHIDLTKSNLPDYTPVNETNHTPPAQ
jgi:sec-independent protein translocase protein TatA